MAQLRCAAIDASINVRDVILMAVKTEKGMLFVRYQTKTGECFALEVPKGDSIQRLLAHLFLISCLAYW